MSNVTLLVTACTIWNLSFYCLLLRCSCSYNIFFQELLSLKFTKQEGAQAWHEDVTMVTTS